MNDGETRVIALRFPAELWSHCKVCSAKKVLLFVVIFSARSIPYNAHKQTFFMSWKSGCMSVASSDL